MELGVGIGLEALVTGFENMAENFGTEENVSKALELGAEDYIMKYNVVPSELPSKVGAILGEASEATVKFVSND